MALEEVVGKIGGDSGDFERAIDRAVSSIVEFDRKVQKSADKASGAYNKMAKASDKTGSSSDKMGKKVSGSTSSINGLATALGGAGLALGGVGIDLNVAGRAFKSLGSAASTAASIAVEAITATSNALVEFGKRGGEVKAVSTSFDTLADRAGLSGERLTSALRKATQGFASDVDLMAASNRLLAAGLPVTEDRFARLAAGAVKLGAALGRNATESIERLTDGLAKQEPELLDELGIRVNLTEAIRLEAQARGVAVNQLSSQARQVAFLNAVEAQLLDRSDALGGEILPAFSSSLSRASVAATNTKDSIAKLIAENEGLAKLTDIVGAGITRLGVLAQKNEKLISSVFTKLGEGLVSLGESFGGVSGIANGTLEFIEGAFKSAGAAVSLLSGPIALTTTKLEALGNIGKVAIGGIGFAASFVAEKVAKAFGSVFDTIAQLAKSTARFGNFVAKIPGLSNLGNKIKTFGDQATLSFVKAGASADTFAAQAKSAKDSFGDDFNEGIDGLGNVIERYREVDDTISNLGDSLDSTGAKAGRLKDLLDMGGPGGGGGSTILGGAFGGIARAINQAIPKFPSILPTSLPAPIAAAASFDGLAADQAYQDERLAALDAYLEEENKLRAKSNEKLFKEQDKADKKAMKAAERAVLREEKKQRRLLEKAEKGARGLSRSVQKGFSNAEDKLITVAEKFALAAGNRSGIRFVSAAEAGITNGLTREFTGPLSARFALESQRKADKFIQGQFGFSGGSFGASSGETAIRVLGFSDGGIVPGMGRGDTQPALLEPREEVVSVSDRRSLLQAFQEGGGRGGDTFNIENITISGAGRNAGQQVDELIRELKRRRALGQG